MVSARPLNAPPLLFLLGPTASGKTALACRLADDFPVELVNVDSASVYRGLDIGSAKPDALTRARYPHHLMDWVDPDDPYSAARFVADVTPLLAAIRARGHVPLLVGGTMLYFQALQQGLAVLPSASPELRSALEARAEQEGWPALHAELARVDPVTAARLAPLDRQRIQRALEVWHVTGQPLSFWHQEQAHTGSPDRILTLGLMPGQRAALHERIAHRFDQMLAQGLVEEVRQLRLRYPRLTGEMPAMRAVGYRQVWQFLEGEGSASEMRLRGIIATRQLARRQLTWVRNWPARVALDPDQTEWEETARALVEHFLKGP